MTRVFEDVMPQILTLKMMWAYQLNKLSWNSPKVSQSCVTLVPETFMSCMDEDMKNVPVCPASCPQIFQMFTWRCILLNIVTKSFSKWTKPCEPYKRNCIQDGSGNSAKNCKGFARTKENSHQLFASANDHWFQIIPRSNAYNCLRWRRTKPSLSVQRESTYFQT